MTTWKRKPQERNNQKYFFSGKFYFTKGVFEKLSFDEIVAIYNDVRRFAKERKGIDYLQVYVNDKGEKLYFIDQLDKTMLSTDYYEPEHNYCTLLLREEY
jgi:hypothetical protein